MLTIKPLTPDDWDAMRDLICEADQAELLAAGVSIGAMRHVQGQALWMGDRLVCLFGVEPIPGCGVPWMLSTRHLEQVPRAAMARVSARVVRDWRQAHGKLANLIHRRNRAALRFVQWLGFTIERQPQGPRQEFYLFSWSRHV